MRRALVGILVATLGLAALPSCATNKDVCGVLRDDLKRCGVPVLELDCGRLELSAEEALVSRIETRGCEGLATQGTEDVDPRLCALTGWPCPASPTPAPGTSVSRFPLVFVSGIDGSPVFDWNPRIVSALKATGGTEAYHVQVLPWATTAERGADLWQSLESLRAHLGTKLNLVCYAVGGLDCRYVTSPNGLFKGDATGYAKVADSVASVTTVSTPHRGTRVAEAALALLDSSAAHDLIQSLIGDAAPTVPDDAALRRTLKGLTLEALLTFNHEITDAPGIYYQSWAGVSHVLAKTSDASEKSIREHCTDNTGALLFLRNKDTRDAMNQLLFVTAPFSSTTLGDEGNVVLSPSDGMVSVESAKWGVFRGCIPADHYDVIGQIGNRTRDGLTGFDAPEFYRFLATDLATRGF